MTKQLSGAARFRKIAHFVDLNLPLRRSRSQLSRENQFNELKAQTYRQQSETTVEDQQDDFNFILNHGAWGSVRGWLYTWP